jgi:hypothetical protein
MATKSLFRNTLPLSTLNPGTWREFLPNSMIPIDRGRGVGGTLAIFANSLHPERFLRWIAEASEQPFLLSVPG